MPEPSKPDSTSNAPPSAELRTTWLISYCALVIVSGLVDWRVLWLTPIAASVCACTYGGTILLAVIVAHRRSASYWPGTASLVAFLFASHATVLASAFASSSPDVDPVSGWHFARCIALALGAVHYWGLMEAKAGVVVCAALAPLAVMRPLLLLDPSSWASQHRHTALGLISVEVPICLAVALLAALGSRRAAAELRETRALLVELEFQAAQTQGLLEAAMPPAIARALLEDTPPEELAAEFASASIAFVALDEYAAIAAESPLAAMSWLDRVYVAFDGLVDAYGERVNKIEVVANTYLLSTGLPVEAADHAHVMAAFAADLLALCKHVPGVGRVSARVGLHCGPVAAGFVGRSRRFFRVFGDTVNVASRMMSLGESGRIHMSSAFVAMFQADSIDEPMLDGALHPDSISLSFTVCSTAIPRPALLPAGTQLIVERRGIIDVKGKGPCMTHWLVPQPSAVPIPEGIPTASASTAAQHAAVHVSEPQPPTIDRGSAPVQLVVDTLHSASSACDLVAAFEDEDARRERRAFPAPPNGPDAIGASTAAGGVRSQTSSSWRYIVATNRVGRGLSTIAEGTGVIAELSRSLESGASHSPHPTGAAKLNMSQLPSRATPTLQHLPSAVDLFARLSDHQRRDAGRVAQLYVSKVAGASPKMHGRRSSGLRSSSLPPSALAHARRPIGEAADPVFSPAAAITTAFVEAAEVPGVVENGSTAPPFASSSTGIPQIEHVRVSSAAPVPTPRARSAASPRYVHASPLMEVNFLSPRSASSAASAASPGTFDSVVYACAEERPVSRMPVSIPESFAHASWVDSNPGDRDSDFVAGRSSAVRTRTEESVHAVPRPPFALSIRAHARVTPERLEQAAGVGGLPRSTDRDDALRAGSAPQHLGDSSRGPPSPGGSATTRGSGQVGGTAGSLSVSPQSLHDRVSKAASSLVLRPMKLVTSTRSIGVQRLRQVHAVLTDEAGAAKLPSSIRAGERRRSVSEEAAAAAATGTLGDTPSPRSVSPAAMSAVSSVAQIGVPLSSPPRTITEISRPSSPLALEYIAQAVAEDVANEADGDQSSIEQLGAMSMPGPAAQPNIPTGELSAVQRIQDAPAHRVLCAELRAHFRDAIIYASSAFIVIVFADRGAEQRVQAELQANLETSHAILTAFVAGASAAVAAIRTVLRLSVGRELEPSVITTWAVLGIALVISAFAFAWRNRSSRSSAPLQLYPIFLSTLFISAQAAIAAALLWLPCDDFCPLAVASLLSESTVSVEGERALLWVAFLLCTTTVVSVTMPYHANHIFCRVAVSLSLELATLAALAVKWHVGMGVGIIAVAMCASCHAIAILSNVSFCNIERARFATELALRYASDDAARILTDLFPQHIVQRLVAGEAVEPTVSEGTVVLFCDLAGFTKMASTESASGIMRAMNDVYSAFDHLVEEATLPDGVIWKVETVGDAYIVVAGALPLASHHQLDDQASASVTVGSPLSRLEYAQLSGAARSTRSYLQRVFALALRMQDVLATLRRDLALPLHARIGVHCGTVVSGIVGSQRPRFCVLGPAVIEAERTEAEGSSDRVSCSAEAQRVYLSSTFRFGGGAAGGGTVLIPPMTLEAVEGQGF